MINGSALSTVNDDTVMQTFPYDIQACSDQPCEFQLRILESSGIGKYIRLSV